MGLIFNIQRFSIHDGPGIRDLIFMKGCPLRCLWCSNPESQNSFSELVSNKSRCVGCRKCVEICPRGAVTIGSDGKSQLNWEQCNNCGECAKSCPAGAMEIFGRQVSLEETINIIEEDNAFFWRSGGGVTISGGEPLMQAPFVADLLHECRSRGINTAVETAGNVPWQNIELVCQHTNLLFYDLKHFDAKIHEYMTGVSNELILENIIRISQCFPQIPIIVRTPIVPGYTDSEQNIKRIAHFLRGVSNLKSYELLPYHSYGESKFSQLGRDYSLCTIKPPAQELIMRLKELSKQILGM